MKRHVLIAAALAACLPLASASHSARAADQKTITVFAAASLREAFESAAVAFTKKTGIAVVFDFGGSDTLATQILQGAPASVFASANEKQMKKIADAGLTLSMPQTFARNTLVAIAPAGSVKVRSLSDFSRIGLAVVLAAPTVPVGTYARTALAKMNAHLGYPADFSATVEKNVVSNELDVKAVATKIALGEGEAGIVYATDVTSAIAPKLRVIALPPEAAVDALYPIAALKSGPDAEASRAFVDFIQHEGRPYLKERGFLTP